MDERLIALIYEGPLEEEPWLAETLRVPIASMTERARRRSSAMPFVGRGGLGSGERDHGLQ